MPVLSFTRRVIHENNPLSLLAEIYYLFSSLYLAHGADVLQLAHRLADCSEEEKGKRSLTTRRCVV